MTSKCNQWVTGFDSGIGKKKLQRGHYEVFDKIWIQNGLNSVYQYYIIYIYISDYIRICLVFRKYILKILGIKDPDHPLLILKWFVRENEKANVAKCK